MERRGLAGAAPAGYDRAGVEVSMVHRMLTCPEESVVSGRRGEMEVRVQAEGVGSGGAE